MSNVLAAMFSGRSQIELDDEICLSSEASIPSCRFIVFDGRLKCGRIHVGGIS